MSFEERLSRAQAAVERQLDAELQPAGGAPERLIAAMRHATLGGGKRIRPFLVIETAAFFGVGTEAALPAATALECVHCYSLVHDDLPAMDDDDLRRGRPTVHKAFDEWTAILAGDALTSLAFEILTRPSADPDPAVRAELVLRLAVASGMTGMAGGQCLDLAAEKLKTPPVPSLAFVTRLQAMKTGALLTYACEAGAILGRASASERGAIVTYGRALGAAFQVADDLLDLEGDASTVGKAVAKDAAAGKPTMVAVLGAEAARQRLAALEAEAIEALSGFGGRARVLAETARFLSRRRS